MNDQAPVRRRTVRVNEISTARMNDEKTQSQYQPYKDAAWGFVNHWYPALFSEELPEQAVEGIQIAGIPILLRRAARQTLCNQGSVRSPRRAPVGQTDLF